MLVLNRLFEFLSSIAFTALLFLVGLASVSQLFANDAIVEGTGTWKAGNPPYQGRDYSSNTPFEVTTLKIGPAALDVYLSTKNALVAPRSALLNWVKDAAISVSTFHGQFPVKHANLIVITDGTHGVHTGVTDSGERMKLFIGRNTSEAEFKSDWTLTHEMFHLGFPDLDENHLWMEEGMAVYLEPIARARAGKLSIPEVWTGMISGLPKGLPKRSDLGLDRTHTWGRTYWGGTLFWFLADIEIRKQTSGKHSVDDVMHAVLKEGGNGSVHWAIERVIRVGDKATETTVLHDLYTKMAFQPNVTDLAQLWKSLGITGDKDSIKTDDTAPLASIRDAITKPAP